MSTSRPYTTQSRPFTAQSRPATGRPKTAASTRNEGNYVVALIESRGVAHEVGIAALDRDTGRVMLTQLADCSTYARTLHQMQVHTPCIILVPDTFFSGLDSSSGKASSGSLLVQYAMEEFPATPIEPVARKYWNDGSAGMEFISQLCVEDDDRAAILVAVADKYYALSAACALFKYVEMRMNTRFAASSVRIRYVPTEGTMMIDPETARNLELVNNITYKKSSHSLFGVMNHTYTPMAARLLRATILAPITVEASLESRLDAVEELVNNEERFSDVRIALKTLNKLDLDKLISSLAAYEVTISSSARPASARVLQMLNLRSLVRNIPNLRRALHGSQSTLLRIIEKMISDTRLDRIDALVAENLNDEAGPAKTGIAAVNARVYAVKANRNRLLDVARETYKENVGDIHQLCAMLCEKHGLPLFLVYQESGYVFSSKKEDLEGELPPGFINVTMQKGRWLFSSLDLKKMNARMKDALDETLMLSDKIVQDMVGAIQGDSGALYKASDAIALVDVLWSFAHVSIIRPEFTGTLAIKAGRHPILETVQSAGTLVSNDVYSCDSSHFQIIRGPNMSGKSTYLRQTGLLAIMAMCGCFVPAEYASFRVHDALLTRLSNDDNMEKSLSTFANEMVTSAMILGLATSQTLVLVDELGRGTSSSEGVGIAHAIAEELIDIKCFTFFATHFEVLSTTLSRQPGVVNLHLSVQRARSSASNIGVTYQYKILDGEPDEMEHYGLELARLADLPADVMSEAHRVSEALVEKENQSKAESRSSKVSIRRRALLKLKTQLTQAYEHSQLPDEELVAYLAKLQREMVKVLHDTL
ncbi:hypothetical protein CONPUDRAFT_45677 [Coniophora puteana RWD-64-598 SS2]|uniref:DNA mismatch repair protein MSH3 n=1 Tax=Coniophora puteana (strain RWD-64-598) TaxID=741705 RepID=A0A5M3N5T6_CONPW|nr:uncharacterized protein CONPUDRAFT_45677 [Coniophora puteana RWD-64-598 SS2]EIW86225.1 hypothetical protein CONPUDRAFT_45677 [Coniophora puteana RWD-64-598 SS2]